MNLKLAIFVPKCRFDMSVAIQRFYLNENAIRVTISSAYCRQPAPRWKIVSEYRLLFVLPFKFCIGKRLH